MKTSQNIYAIWYFFTSSFFSIYGGKIIIPPIIPPCSIPLQKNETEDSTENHHQFLFGSSPPPYHLHGSDKYHNHLTRGMPFNIRFAPFPYFSHICMDLSSSYFLVQEGCKGN